MTITIEGYRGEGKTQVATDITQLLRKAGYTNVTFKGKNIAETKIFEQMVATNQHVPPENKKREINIFEINTVQKPKKC